MKIQKRLLLSILPVVLFTVVAVTTVAISISKGVLENQVKENAVLLTKSYSSQLNAKVLQIKRMSQDLSAAIETAINVETVLLNARKRYPEISRILYTGIDGKIKDMAPYSHFLLDSDFSMKDEWLEAKSKQHVVVSAPTTYMKQDVFLIYSPVIIDYTVNSNPETVGVAVLVIPVNYVFEHIDGVLFGDSGSLFVVNNKGEFLFHKDKSNIMKHRVVDIKASSDLNLIQQSMIDQETGIGSFYTEKEKLLISFAPISVVGWSVALTASYKEFTKRIDRVLSFSALIVFVALILATYFIYLIVRGVARPLSELTDVSDRISHGDFSVRSNIKSKNEVGQLSASFDSMVDKLEDYNKTLEAEVQDRTRDLLAMNEELEATNETLDANAREMEMMNEELRSTNETLDLNAREMEAMNEELRSTNETLDLNAREMEAMNEELRATNETLDLNAREMEAMNEELKVSNEGMEAVNEELNQTVEELDITNRQLATTRDALWSEMELAQRLQTVLLPDNPQIAGFDISAFMTTADCVGGDYYDVINVDGRDWFLIGDVSGHGVTAGLIMMMVQTSLHIALSQNPEFDPVELLAIINKTIHSNISKLGGNRYMTLTVFACLEHNRFTFAGAHLPVILYRKATDSIEVLETPGAWIGLVEDINNLNENREFNMETGDVMLLYTDGISEAVTKDGENYSQMALAKLFKEHIHLESKGICNAIKESSKTLNVDDDVTVLVLKKV